MKVGSQTHKELFCRDFIANHLEYEPERLAWPQLNEADRDRLRKIPFWEQALNTELEAEAKINAYLPSVSDPLIREAIALQGEEEARHGRLFKFMIQHYGIELPGNPPAQLPKQIEPAFVEFGYGECLDSFLGFGLFKIARQAKFLPESMFEIFDLLLQEEARHIFFFVNWIAYFQASQGRGARILRATTSLWHYSKAVRGMMALVNDSAEASGNDFTATESSVFMDDFSVEKLISECLEENTRRMSSFNPELLQPQLLPSLAKIALSTLKRLPKRNVQLST